MDTSELQKSVGEFMNQRLKSPYIASVIGYWLYVNRVWIFGLFNFDDGLSFNQKISWIHKIIQSQSFCWFNGLNATIWESLLMGFLVLAVSIVFITFGKALVKYMSKGSNWLLNEIQPSNWVELDEHKRIVEDLVKTQSELNNTRTMLSEERKKISEIEETSTEVRKLKLSLESKIKEHESQIEEKDKMIEKLERRISRQGKYDSSKEAKLNLDIIKKHNKNIEDTKLDLTKVNDDFLSDADIDLAIERLDQNGLKMDFYMSFRSLVGRNSFVDMKKVDNVPIYTNLGLIERVPKEATGYVLSKKGKYVMEKLMDENELQP